MKSWVRESCTPRSERDVYSDIYVYLIPQFNIDKHTFVLYNLIHQEECLMKITRAYQFRLYPTPEQEVLIHKTFGCTRFLYNQIF